MNNRVQRLPEPFWARNHKQNDSRTIVYFNKDVETITNETRPNKLAIVGDDSVDAKKEGFAMVARAAAAGKIAICFAYNPVTKQSEVINFAEVGVYADMIRKPNVVAAIEKSKREVFPDGIPKVQIIK